MSKAIKYLFYAVFWYIFSFALMCHILALLSVKVLHVNLEMFGDPKMIFIIRMTHILFFARSAKTVFDYKKLTLQNDKTDHRN